MRSVVINAGLERLTDRLQQFCPLGPEDRLALAGALSTDRAFAPREALPAGRRPGEGLHLIVEGFACRCKLLPDGRRQILGLLLPGDLCDLRVLVLGRLGRSLGAVSAGRASAGSRATLAAAVRDPRRLARALWWLTAWGESLTHRWLVNVG